MKNYTENSAVARVERGGASVNWKVDKFTGNIVKTISARDVGNRTWGAIDYLIKYHKYILRNN